MSFSGNGDGSDFHEKTYKKQNSTKLIKNNVI